MHVGGGRHVSVHLEIARLCARCALPFEKSNSSAAPGQHSTRSFKKATVNATVNVRSSLACFVLLTMQASQSMITTVSLTASEFMIFWVDFSAPR